jgi:hypothetical protein
VRTTPHRDVVLCESTRAGKRGRLGRQTGAHSYVSIWYHMLPAYSKTHPLLEGSPIERWMIGEPGSSASQLEHQGDCKASMAVKADHVKIRKGASALLISLGQHHKYYQTLLRTRIEHLTKLLSPSLKHLTIRDLFLTQSAPPLSFSASKTKHPPRRRYTADWWRLQWFAISAVK